MDAYTITAILLSGIKISIMKKSILFFVVFISVLQLQAQKLVELKLLLPGQLVPASVTCEKKDGNYFMEGDILIDVSQIIKTPFIKKAVGRNSEYYLWPNGIVPYTIQKGHPRYSDIVDAIAHINDKTNIELVARTNENNYIYLAMKSRNSCYSYIGRIGGEQIVNIGSGCGYGSIIHEICHALGFWHEQSRADRDNYVTIHWDNIEKEHQHNFSKHIKNATLFGNYDYSSIMHYGKYAFSKNRKPTIVCKQANCSIGQRKGLSAQDIEAINTMYPRASPPPKPSKKKTAIEITVSDMLHQEIGSGQWKEEVFLRINNQTHRMNLNMFYRPLQTLTIQLPHKGTYNYELLVYSYSYKCSFLKCAYRSAPVAGRGAGSLKLSSNASFSIYTDNTYNPDKSIKVFLKND